MSLILNIDTAQETAMVCLTDSGIPLFTIENAIQKDHAVFLHKAIKELQDKSGISLKQLAAIAVTKGPGSYTGIRVGMSTAKGLCYALKKPLITIGSLELLASDGIRNLNNDSQLICPMIDARRMEVFTALYDFKLNEINQPSAMILDQDSFHDTLKSKKIYFIGSGSAKINGLIIHPNAFFIPVNNIPESMGKLAYNELLKSNWADLTLTEPLYVKEHQSISELKKS